MLRFVVFCLLGFVATINAESILIMQPFGCRSHSHVMGPLAAELDRRGHRVTFVSSVDSNKNTSNINHIVLSEQAGYFKRLQKITTDLGTHGFRWSTFQNYYALQSDSCHLLFKSNILQKWMNSNVNFDLVLMDASMNECVLPLWPFLGKNVILYSTALMTPITASTFSVPVPVSYVPMLNTPYKAPFTFLQRALNTYNWIFNNYIEYLAQKTFYEEIVRQYFPNVKPFHETVPNISLAFVNADPVINTPRPTLPSVINIGGIHCHPARPLPEGRLKDFVDGSGEDGFILVSFGSSYVAAMAPTEFRNIFLTAFARIKQRVVWKFESQIDNLPDNVMVIDWLPQQDLLGHPKIRAFVNHGGLLSLQEGIYHNVPQVCLPITPTDPPSYVALTAGLGVAVELDVYAFSPDSLVSAINKACNDPGIRRNVQKQSQLFRDHPQHPLDAAVYWVEYVMKYNGAHHLRGAAGGLTFYQYFLFDVIALVIAVFIIVVVIFWFLMKRLFGTYFLSAINQFRNISLKIKLQ